jgi:hypothetical protein
LESYSNRKIFFAGEVVQVVEHLPSKHEILSSFPSTEKENKSQIKLLWEMMVLVLVPYQGTLM